MIIGKRGEFDDERRKEGPSADRVREPVQVYLDREDSERLERLRERLGVTKSEVLRRGLTSLEARGGTPQVMGTRTELPTFRGRGLCPGVNLDSNSAVLDLMEDDGASG